MGKSSIAVKQWLCTEKGIQKYRDITMRWKQGADLIILACENQNKVHYAMPVRMMLYDALSYTEQLQQVWKTRDPGIKPKEQEYL